jgi:hypothetical protein
MPERHLRVRPTTICLALMAAVAAYAGIPARAAGPAAFNVANRTMLRIDGAPTGDALGSDISGAGDINGDGLADLAIGAPNTDKPRRDAGAVYVVFGRRSSSRIALPRLGTRGFRIDGIAGSRLGNSVAAAGDVNGDGLGDIVLGALRADLNRRRDSGSSFVVFGKRDSRRVDLARLGAGGFRIDGARAGDLSGLPVAGPGDVNGDGRPDLLIGSIPKNRANSSVAIAWVVYGAADTTTVDLAALGARGFAVNGYPVGGAMALPTSGAGDFNGDGFADILVGSSRQGVPFDPLGRTLIRDAYVVFGKADGLPVEVTNLGAAGVAVSGPTGSYGAAAGDVNGDGLGDVALGSRSCGPAAVVFGRPGPGTVDVANLGSAGFPISIPRTLTCVDQKISGGGDVNGDGLADLLVAATAARETRRHGKYLGSGAVFRILGGPSPVNVSRRSRRVVRVDRALRNSIFGGGLAVIGDASGDGFADIAVSEATFDRSGRDFRGSVFVVSGRRTGGR